MEVIKITNIEQINEFMSKIEDDWDTLKKARYILVKLCQIYNYNPEYNYSDFGKKGEMLRKAIDTIEKNNNSSLSQMPKDFIEDKNKICVELAPIYEALLKQAGVEDAEQMYGDAIVRTEKGPFLVNISKALLSCKIMSSPEGFGDENQLPLVKQVDQELGFIEEEYNKIDGNLINKNEEIPLRDKLKKLFSLRETYIENVLGRKLSNVEFHKYYKILLKTYFSEKNVSIFPIHNGNYNDIKYVVMGKENNDFCYFIYLDDCETFGEIDEKTLKDIIKKGYKVADKYDISL